MAFKRPESVLVVVHTRDGQVLLMQRTGQGSEAFWQSITGSLEPGESCEEAAPRELVEETGLRLEVQACNVSSRYAIRAAALHKYPPDTRYNTEYLYHVLIDAPVAITLSPNEHVDYAWLPKGEALARCWSWSNVEAIRQLVAEGYTNE